jgi:hypothetical protein
VNGWNERVDWPEGQKEVRRAFRGAGAGGGTRPGGATLSGLAAAAGAVQLLSAYLPVIPDRGGQPTLRVFRCFLLFLCLLLCCLRFTVHALRFAHEPTSRGGPLPTSESHRVW